MLQARSCLLREPRNLEYVMEEEHLDEIRVRVAIDRDMPDLLNRLKASKRHAREVVHLMRLGLQMENLLNSNVRLSMSMAQGAASTAPDAGAEEVGVTGSEGNAVRSVKDAGRGTPLGTEIAAATGLDPDYFSGLPGAGAAWS